MIKIKLIVVLWIFNVALYGQQTLNPIIYVYDTIIIHDTIRIRKPRVLEKLPTLFVEKTLEMPPKTATFSTKSILLSKPLVVSKQKNKNNMKKNVLWAMMLWTLPDLWAQTHLNLTMGGGMHQRLVGTQIEDLRAESFKIKNVKDVAPLAAHLQMGLHVFRYTRNKQFIYGAGLDYHRMFSTDYYRPPILVYVFHVNEPALNSSNYSLWSLPIYAKWNAKYAKPLLGITLDYKQLSENWTLNYSGGCIDWLNGTIFPDKPKPVRDIKLSLLAGIEIPISSNYAFQLNYVHQLLGKERWAIRWDEPYAASDYKIKNYRFEFTFVAHLKEF